MDRLEPHPQSVGVSMPPNDYNQGTANKNVLPEIRNYHRYNVLKRLSAVSTIQEWI